MNKFLSSFTHTPEINKRPEIFLKKLEENNRKSTPQLTLDELTALERQTYQVWWKDLDPFDIGTSNIKSIFHFISAFELPDTALEQIFALFQDQKNEITQQQFFAILRLIAHAQNKKTITRDIIYLGAPLPKIRKETVVPSSSILPFAEINTNVKKSSHHRSRSAPQNKLTAMMLKDYSKDDQDIHKDTGQDLLLTKSFKPNFEPDTPTTNNPYNPYYNQRSKNTYCNADQMPPPPVPPQSTKPPYPKYTRREPAISK